MQWICRRFILFTFNLPCLLPITLAHGSFKIIIETKIYTLRSSSNLMQWTYASLRPFTPYCPTCFLTVDFPSLLRSLVNLTFGRKRCVGPILRLILITFPLPYLLPHCGFSFTASQFGKSYVRKKVMQWICRRFTPPSSTALLFPRRLID